MKDSHLFLPHTSHLGPHSCLVLNDLHDRCLPPPLPARKFTAAQIGDWSLLSTVSPVSRSQEVHTDGMQD